MSTQNQDQTNGAKQSRKYLLAILIFVVSSILVGVPPIVSVLILKQATPLIVLTGSEWVTVISLLAGLYFGSNVAQKKLLLGQNDSQNTDNQAVVGQENKLENK